MKTALGKKLEGPAGTATEVLYLREESDDIAWRASIAVWFLDCPDQSPAWRHYRFGCVHLRTIEGIPEAKLHREGVTHEFTLTALDPRDKPNPIDPITWMELRPINLCEQIQLPNDGTAHDIAEMCVKEILAGYLWAEPPLSGQSEPWRTQLQLLAEHARGEHPVPPESVQ